MCTLSSYTTEGVVWTVPAENVILPQISEWISSETNEECRCVIVRVEGKMKIWERNERGRGGGEMRGNEDEKGRFAHFNELTAGVRTTGLELQPSVCVCVFDLYIYDGALPVCLLLPGLSDSIGDQQLDKKTVTTHIWNPATVSVHIQVSFRFLRSQITMLTWTKRGTNKTQTTLNILIFWFASPFMDCCMWMRIT